MTVIIDMHDLYAIDLHLFGNLESSADTGKLFQRCLYRLPTDFQLPGNADSRSCIQYIVFSSQIQLNFEHLIIIWQHHREGCLCTSGVYRNDSHISIFCFAIGQYRSCDLVHDFPDHRVIDT